MFAGDSNDESLGQSTDVEESGDNEDPLHNPSIHECFYQPSYKDAHLTVLDSYFHYGVTGLTSYICMCFNRWTFIVHPASPTKKKTMLCDELQEAAHRILLLSIRVI